jgi:hypothetical protein
MMRCLRFILGFVGKMPSAFGHWRALTGRGQPVPVNQSSGGSSRSCVSVRGLVHGLENLQSLLKWRRGRSAAIEKCDGRFEVGRIVQRPGKASVVRRLADRPSDNQAAAFRTVVTRLERRARIIRERPKRKHASSASIPEALATQRRYIRGRVRTSWSVPSSRSELWARRM